MIITLEKIIIVIAYELITILLSIVYILIIMGLMKNKSLNSLRVTKQNLPVNFKIIIINSSDNTVMISSTIDFKDQLIDDMFFIVEYNNEDNAYKVIDLAFFTEEYKDNLYLS